MSNATSNISISLSEEQLDKLNTLVTRSEIGKNRSSWISMAIDREFEKLELAEMVADAKFIDDWSEEEEACQIIDMEQFG